MVRLASNQTGGVEVTVPLSIDGIAWESDIERKFKNPLAVIPLALS